MKYDETETNTFCRGYALNIGGGSFYFTINLPKFYISCLIIELYDSKGYNGWDVLEYKNGLNLINWLDILFKFCRVLKLDSMIFDVIFLAEHIENYQRTKRLVKD